jgi:hypothetical protein
LEYGGRMLHFGDEFFILVVLLVGVAYLVFVLILFLIEIHEPLPHEQP